MKKILGKLTLASLILVGLAAPAFADGKIATIDLRKVFDGYWKTKEADSSLKDTAADMDKEYKNLADDWKTANDEYKKLSASAGDQAVSADERDRRKKAADAKLLAIRESEQNIDSFRRQSAAKLDEQKRRMRDKILAEIQNAVNAKAKSAAYTFVLDSAAESANATPVVVFNAGENDITDDILAQLNASAPVKPAAAAADKK
jgi:Skp family chaperone for outer membrane proteins